MTRQRLASLLAGLALTLAGCQTVGGPVLPSAKPRYLSIVEVCVSRNDNDCPSADVRANGRAYTVPDPGRGPIKIEWQTMPNGTTTVDHVQTIALIRRVRYWNEERIAARAERDGYSPDDPKFRAWAQALFGRDISYLTLFFLPDGRVAAEATDTPGTLCRDSHSEYCPQDGTEE